MQVARLVACPFCRELFEDGESERCPECDVALVPMERLPPSLDALHDELADGLVTPPEDRRLPLSYAGRGRGALFVLALLGLGAFFLPWVELHRPNELVYRGFDLARGRAGWLWGGAVAWFVMLPLVVTRRTVRAMRGARVVCALFAAMTLGEIVMLVALPPSSGSRYLTYDYTWGWGLYSSAVVSMVGLIVAVRFGGRVDDLPALPWEDPHGRVRRDTSAGEVLH